MPPPAGGLRELVMDVPEAGPPISRWLANAKEARALAETMTDDGAGLMLFRIAAAYEDMARTAITRAAAAQEVSSPPTYRRHREELRPQPLRKPLLSQVRPHIR